MSKHWHIESKGSKLLQLQRLADLAKTVEKQNDPQQLVADKQQLINAMHEVVEQAQQWLHQYQSE